MRRSLTHYILSYAVYFISSQECMEKDYENGTMWNKRTQNKKTKKLWTNAMTVILFVQHAVKCLQHNCSEITFLAVIAMKIRVKMYGTDGI